MKTGQENAIVNNVREAWKAASIIAVSTLINGAMAWQSFAQGKSGLGAASVLLTGACLVSGGYLYRNFGINRQRNELT